jgi:branched-chain amino acid transport system ATP-binding protein
MSATADNAVPLVLIEDIHTYYGKSHILHGVSLAVGPGEVVGLLGRNGVGKSTTLKTVMGLVQPSQGAVLLEGNAITGLAPHKLARLGIGYVPEDRRIFRLLTVMENLRTGLDRHGVTEERRQTLLDKVFTYFPVLAERRNQAGGTLSGGEQQMLAMARALMGRPKLILMDEPTMGLSPLYVDKVLELIVGINRQGITVFMVEQNADLALQIAHEGYVLQTGRIVLHGSAAELRDDPRIREAYLGGGAAA